jgi:hypothetical protein
MASKHSASRELILRQFEKEQGNLVWESEGCQYITADCTQGSDIWTQTNGKNTIVGTLKVQDSRYWLESTTCKTCGAGDGAHCRCPPNTDADMDTGMFGNVFRGVAHALGHGPVPVAQISSIEQVQTEKTAAETKLKDDNDAADAACTHQKNENQAAYMKRTHELTARGVVIAKIPNPKQQLPSLSVMEQFSSENEFLVRTDC